MITHAVDVLYSHRHGEPDLGQTITAVIKTEEARGFTCIGVQKVCDRGITDSMWLLLFAKSEQLPTRT